MPSYQPPAVDHVHSNMKIEEKPVLSENCTPAVYLMLSNH